MADGIGYMQNGYISSEILKAIGIKVRLVILSKSANLTVFWF